MSGVTISGTVTMSEPLLGNAYLGTVVAFSSAQIHKCYFNWLNLTQVIDQSNGRAVLDSADMVVLNGPVVITQSPWMAKAGAGLTIGLVAGATFACISRLPFLASKPVSKNVSVDAKSKTSTTPMDILRNVISASAAIGAAYATYRLMRPIFAISAPGIYFL